MAALASAGRASRVELWVPGRPGCIDGPSGLSGFLPATGCISKNNSENRVQEPLPPRRAIPGHRFGLTACPTLTKRLGWSP